MDLLKSLPTVENKELQAREVFTLLNNARSKGGLSAFYRPPDGAPLDPTVKSMVEQKGYKVIPQIKYDLTWTDNGPLRGASRVVYWFGIPGRR